MQTSLHVQTCPEGREIRPKQIQRYISLPQHRSPSLLSFPSPKAQQPINPPLQLACNAPLLRGQTHTTNKYHIIYFTPTSPLFPFAESNRQARQQKRMLRFLITHRHHYSPLVSQTDKLGNKLPRALRQKLRSIKNKVNVHKCTKIKEVGLIVIKPP